MLGSSGLHLSYIKLAKTSVSRGLKLSDITTMYQTLDPRDTANYRPVSFLPLLSKVFEKIVYD